MIKVIDAGNYETKFYDGRRMHKFPSDIGFDFRTRKLEQKHGDYDWVWEYNGRKGFAGTLAQEAESGGCMGGDSKAHDDAKLRILLALHQFSSDSDHDIIVGQPISRHTTEEKQAIKRMLVGKHLLKVNGETKIVNVRRCEVAAEGVVAGLLTPVKGILRTIDVGSATVNFGSLKDGKFLDLGSWSETIGMNTFTHADYHAIGRTIAIKALHKWKRDDKVLTSGGGAPFVFAAIQTFFPNAELLPDSTYANARAFWEIAKKVYS